MPTYNYKARDKFGKAVTGLMSAESEDAISSKLKQMGYAPISIKEAGEEEQIERFLDKFRRVKFADLNMFMRQFATLQRAGLPILLSLGALREQVSNITLKNAIAQMIRDIEAGSPLSSSLEKHPKIFNTLYINMIKSGEASGNLDEVLDRLAVLGEHDEKIKTRMKSATRYPVLVIVSILIGFLILTTFVVPRFANIYGQLDVALPLPTQILIWLNYAITKFWWLTLIIISGLITAFIKFINTKGGRVWWDTVKLKTPVFGPLVLKLSMSRFARTTSILMRSGLPLLEILELVSGSVGNEVIARTVDNIEVSVNEGRGMTEPMKVSGMFPPIIIQMVAVGEQTGKIDELLLHVSNYYDSQVDYTIDNFASLIEPILIFVLGCAVLMMALGIFLPMWNLMSLFRG